VNRKRVVRLMREMGLQHTAPRRRVRTIDSTHTNPRYPNRVAGLAVSRPDQVWMADITYARLAQSFAYLAVLMDLFTRSIRGWSLSARLD
jgi:transposase InsO family protein